MTPCNGTTINVGLFPETPEGWHQHRLAATAWNTKWGETTLPALDRLYPLSPGTAAVRSQECFHCGQCMNPPHSVAENSCSHTVINAVECSFRAHYRFGLNDSSTRPMPVYPVAQSPSMPSLHGRQALLVHQITTLQSNNCNYELAYTAFYDQGNEGRLSG